MASENGIPIDLDPVTLRGFERHQPVPAEFLNNTDPPKFATEIQGEWVESPENIRAYNVGASDYAQHKIQPWDIWLEYNLNPWDADIIKRVLRQKEGEERGMDYLKIIHICKERIRQIKEVENGNA